MDLLKEGRIALMHLSGNPILLEDLHTEVIDSKTHAIAWAMLTFHDLVLDSS